MFNEYESEHSMSIDDVDNQNDFAHQDLILNHTKANEYVTDNKDRQSRQVQFIKTRDHLTF